MLHAQDESNFVTPVPGHTYLVCVSHLEGAKPFGDEIDARISSPVEAKYIGQRLLAFEIDRQVYVVQPDKVLHPVDPDECVKWAATLKRVPSVR